MKVRVFGTLRNVVGHQKHVEVRAADGASARELLDQLIVVWVHTMPSSISLPSVTTPFTQPRKA